MSSAADLRLEKSIIWVEAQKELLEQREKTSLLGFPSREGSQGRKALKSSLKDLHRQK